MSHHERNIGHAVNGTENPLIELQTDLKEVLAHLRNAHAELESAIMGFPAASGYTPRASANQRILVAADDWISIIIGDLAASLERIEEKLASMGALPNQKLPPEGFYRAEAYCETCGEWDNVVIHIDEAGNIEAQESEGGHIGHVLVVATNTIGQEVAYVDGGLDAVDIKKGVSE